MGWFSWSSLFTLVLAFLALVPGLRDAEEIILTSLPLRMRRFRIPIRIAYICVVLALTAGVILTSESERRALNDATIASQQKLAKTNHDADVAQFKQIIAALTKLAPGPVATPVVNNYYRLVTPPQGVTTAPHQAPEEVSLQKWEIARPFQDARGWHLAANIYYQNGRIGGENFYRAATLLTSQKSTEYNEANATKLRMKANVTPSSPPSDISPNEQQWFSVISEPVSLGDVNEFLLGKRSLFFGGTIVVRNAYGSTSTPFCAFTVGASPFQLHICPSG